MPDDSEIPQNSKKLKKDNDEDDEDDGDYFWSEYFDNL